MKYAAAMISALLFGAALAPALAAAQQLEVPQGAASLNWAGYVAQADAGAYTGVAGTWVVPSVASTPAASGDATWVGIGGVSSRDLIQAGTQAIVGSGGAVTYNAWLETLPGYSQTVPLAVHPGDRISASLAQVRAGLWSVTIVNDTAGTHYTTSVAYDSSRSSAEWVEEMVSQQGGAFRPLDNFSSVGFMGGSVTVAGAQESVAQSGAQPLQMINGAGQVLAGVSSLGADGASFTVARGGAAASASPTYYQRRGWRIIETATSTGAAPQPTVRVIIYRGSGAGDHDDPQQLSAPAAPFFYQFFFGAMRGRGVHRGWR